VGLNQGRILPDSRWRIPGRSRSRDLAGSQQPGAEAAMLSSFQACPVAADAGPGLTADLAPGLTADLAPGLTADLAPGLTADLAALTAGWSFADEDTLALDHLLASAERFVALFHSENRAGSPERRLRQVRREVESTGTYWHTPAELEFGARVAWRNSARCIGRLYWHSLQVRDRREVTTAPEIAAESFMHLRQATNGGRIRPVITVFAPDAPDRPGPRIVSSQLVRYAGYLAADGSVTGDPATTEITRTALRLGWRGGRPGGRFDVLPLLVRQAGAPVTLHEIPSDAVLEVRIRHPEFGWFADLGLRWYAVPVISDMYLDIGGVRYPAAPFNGWYMCTEIGSRDLGDSGRYDQLPVIARRMGLGTASDRTLWKDKAVTELNLAVLHSFGEAGVTISDHHTESVRFLQHLAREERQGRTCPADWTWIVPPTASSATPVFHRSYQNFDQAPNFYRRRLG
jgi:nitric-oxide synthase